MKKIYIVFLLIAACFLIYFIDNITGNPLNKALATSYAKQFTANVFNDENYTLEETGYNYTTEMYDYIVTRDNESMQWSYLLSIDSPLSGRQVDTFKLHPSVINQSLSDRLSEEGKVHVTNIVKGILPKANVDYVVAVPNGLLDTDTVWVPGFEIDVNASIFISSTVEGFDATQSAELANRLIEAFSNTGITYSRLSIRFTEERLENGINFMKTIYKNEFFHN